MSLVYYSKADFTAKWWYELEFVRCMILDCC